MTFSEGIGPTVNLAGLHVRESGSSTGGFALTGAAHAVSGETVTFTLTPSQQASFAALTTPQLDIEADAVSDLSENGIEAAPDLAITIDDTAPPTFSSAGYTTGERGARGNVQREPRRDCQPGQPARPGVWQLDRRVCADRRRPRRLRRDRHVHAHAVPAGLLCRTHDAAA